MLSVQSAGCAGMERLGVPARTSINSPSDDRGHISRRMRVDAIQARDIIVRDATMLSDRQIRNNHHHYHHRSGCAGSGVRGIDNCSGVIGTSAIPVQSSEKNKSITPQQHQQQQQQQHQTSKTQNVIRCPHHVPLPDSEWGQDRDLQIRPRYQNSEIVRTYITPPPNKTVLDVPEQSFNLYTSSGISCNLGANYNNLQQYYQQHNNNNHHHQNNTNYQQQQQQHQQAQQQQQQKSKPNVIQKLFSRKSSPKSPQPSPTLLSSSSCSSVASSASSTSSSSTSTSSSSSLSCTVALPISIASALTTTSCNLGTNILAGPPMHQSISSQQQQQQILQQSTSLPIGSVSIPLLTLGTTSVPQTTHNIDNNDIDITTTTSSSTETNKSDSIDILNGTTAPTLTTNINSNNIHYKYDQLIRIDNNTTTISTNPSIISSICSSTAATTTSNSTTTLQLYKSKSCNLSQISLASSSSSTSSSMGSLSPHSTDCCYTQATNVRPRPKTPNDYSGKQQQHHHHHHHHV